MQKIRFKIKRPIFDERSINLEVSALDSDRIIINFPGYLGGLRGYAEKYERMKERILDHKLGAVILTPGYNQISPFFYCENLRRQVVQTIEWTIENAKNICGNDSPKIGLIGNSAGASGICAVSAKYPQVDKMLVISPSLDAGTKTIKTNLPNYEGEIKILVWDRDWVGGSKLAKMFYKLAKKATNRAIQTIPNCDHGFKSEKNLEILCNAPLEIF